MAAPQVSVRSVEGVKVAVRIKPPSKDEQSCISTAQNSLTLSFPSGDRDFTYDNVFSNATQAEVYSCVKPLVDACSDGFRGTVLCYGATGSGKTMTIFGDLDDAGEDGKFEVQDKMGLVPRAAWDLFVGMERMGIRGGAVGVSVVGENQKGDRVDVDVVRLGDWGGFGV